MFYINSPDPLLIIFRGMIIITEVYAFLYYRQHEQLRTVILRVLRPIETQSVDVASESESQAGVPLLAPLTTVLSNRFARIFLECVLKKAVFFFRVIF